MSNPSTTTQTTPQTAPQHTQPPCVIIFGGTSGIGLALAVEHQRLGWQVIIIGSSADKIATINKQYPTFISYQCDLSQLPARQALFKQLQTQHFERIIYSAGWYLNERILTLGQADSSQMLAINLQAFHDVFMWASESLKKQQQQLNKAHQKIAQHKHDNKPQYPKPALICLSSIAGTMSYPYSSLYAKCKQAMIATAHAYRMALTPFDIQVTCIASGYVDTQKLRELNAGDASHKPFIIDEATAVRHIMQAIIDDKALAIFPTPMRYLTKVLNTLPAPIFSWVMKKRLDKNTNK